MTYGDEYINFCYKNASCGEIYIADKTLVVQIVEDLFQSP